MTGSLYLSPEELLAEHQWLTGLARSLVDDQHLAEDAVQETCVRALRAAPRDRSRVRQWLASILRNLVRQNLRSERTRQTHETVKVNLAGAAVGESTLDLVERVSIQHRVVASVLRLDETHRSVLLLRFFEGLPQRTIARRLQTPVATINSRLTRALQMVRRDLDRKSKGGRHEWLAAIAPLTVPSTAIGVLLMQSKLLTAAAVLLVGSLIYWFWPAALAAEPDTRPVAAGTPAERTARSEPGVRNAPESRTAMPTATTARPQETTRSEARGLVVFANGQPAPGIHVDIEGQDVAPNPDPVLSDASGNFTLPAADKEVAIITRDPRYVTVMKGALLRQSPVTPVVVIAKRITLAGQVVTNAGAAVAGASLRLHLPAGFETQLPQVLDRSRRVLWETKSIDDGSFTIDAPGIEGIHLLATRRPHRPVKKQLPPQSDRRVYIVLGEDDADDGPVLVGRILDPQEQPVADAFVAAGLTSTVSDENGNFRIVLKRAGEPESIRALKAGFMTARLTPDRAPDGKLLWPNFVELRLAGKAKSIRGRVLDATGEPLTNALVWTPDAEPFGLAGVVPVATEYLSAGGKAPPARRPLPKQVRDNPLVGDHTTGGMWHAKETSGAWFFTETDTDGRFELPGLQDREYRIRAMSRASTQMVTSSPIPAGSRDAELRLDDAELHDEVSGTLVLPDGRPASGVSISVFANVRDTDTRIPGGRFVGELIRHGARTKTDASGRFRLKWVPAQGVRLSIFGDDIIPRFYRITDEAEQTNLRIEVLPRHHLEMILSDPDRGDSIRGEDAAGQKQYFSQIRSGSMKQTASVPLHEGRSGVLVVPHTLRTIILYKGENEVERVSITLEFGKKRVVRL